MKELIQIPLVHVEWALRPKVSERLFGKNPNQDVIKKIIKGHKSYWDAVDKYLRQEHFDKLYQDTSVVEYPVKKFLDEFRENISKDRNVDAFFELVEKGVEFIRTESIHKINESRERKLFEIPNCLEPRDLFIAQNIYKTLEEGERGVLFLGVCHRADRILNERYQEIKVTKFPQDPTYLYDLFQSIAIKH